MSSLLNTIHRIPWNHFPNRFVYNLKASKLILRVLMSRPIYLSLCFVWVTENEFITIEGAVYNTTVTLELIIEPYDNLLYRPKLLKTCSILNRNVKRCVICVLILKSETKKGQRTFKSSNAEVTLMARVKRK